MVSTHTVVTPCILHFLCLDYVCFNLCPTLSYIYIYIVSLRVACLPLIILSYFIIHHLFVLKMLLYTIVIQSHFCYPPHKCLSLPISSDYPHIFLSRFQHFPSIPVLFLPLPESAFSSPFHLSTSPDIPSFPWVVLLSLSPSPLSNRE